MRQNIVAAIVALLFGAAAWAVLAGCAHPRPRPSAPPPAPVSTVEIRRAHTVNREATSSAKTRVEYVTKEIETIREVVSPEVSEQLRQLQLELMRVTADLRKAEDATVAAEGQATIIADRAETLRLWGIDQQQVAEANAIGWRREEQLHAGTKGELEKAKAVANKRGNLVGLLGAGTLGALGLKAMAWFPPYSFALPVVGLALGYFGARFIL